MQDSCAPSSAQRKILRGLEGIFRLMETLRDLTLQRQDVAFTTEYTEISQRHQRFSVHLRVLREQKVLEFFSILAFCLNLGKTATNF